MTKELTANDQIDGKLAELLTGINQALSDNESEKMLDDVLGVSKTLTTRLTLSWGGPADYVELDQDENGDVVAGRYIFAEWGDVATKELEGDELDKVAEFYSVYLDEMI